MKRYFAVSRCRQLERNAKTIAVLVALFVLQFAYAGNEADSTLRLDLNEKTLALQKTTTAAIRNISVERQPGAEEVTASRQAAQSEQSNTTEAEPKAPASYETDLMRRMGFTDKEIARGAEQEHNWRIQHDQDQAEHFFAQLEDVTQYARQHVKENPAYTTVVRGYETARSLYAQGEIDKANAVVERANQILEAVQNLERNKAIAGDINKFVRHQQQQAAAQAKRQKEEDAEAAEEDEESLGKLKAEVQSAQFSHQPASSISTFGLENNHSNPDLDRLERQVDDAKFSHEPATAIHP
jgi:hypothetical protein